MTGVLPSLINATPTAARANAHLPRGALPVSPLPATFCDALSMWESWECVHTIPICSVFYCLLLGRRLLLPLYSWLEAGEKAKCRLLSDAGSTAPLLTPPHSWPPCLVSSSFSCPQDTSFEMEETTSVWVRGVIKMQWHTSDFSDGSLYCVDSNHETITELRERQSMLGNYEA